MLYGAQYLHGCHIDAQDGRIGTVQDLLFDDRGWQVRYVVVATGGILAQHQVLLAPSALQFSAGSYQLRSALTKAEIAASPPLSSNLPLSRQYEEKLSEHYGWPAYWALGDMPVVGGLGMFDTMGRGYVPGAGVSEVDIDRSIQAELAATGSEVTGDSHLRSVAELTGYKVETIDYERGWHVREMLVSQDEWELLFAVVSRGHWPFRGARAVVVPRAAVAEVSWARQAFKLNWGDAELDQAPEFDWDSGVKPAYEAKLRNRWRVTTARAGDARV